MLGRRSMDAGDPLRELAGAVLLGEMECQLGAHKKGEHDEVSGKDEEATSSFKGCEECLPSRDTQYADAG